MQFGLVVKFLPDNRASGHFVVYTPYLSKRA
jgi:hypothetical protein